jgi:L-2,4-diaminobutyrate decarboxylase
MTFKLMGTDLFGRIIDSTIHLAKETAQLLENNSCFEVLITPEFNAVLFRYIPSVRSEERDYVNEINLKMQRTFYENGELIVAKTKQNGSVYLKFTMLNPLNTIHDMKEHIERMKKMGEKIEKEQGGTRYEYSVHH